MKWFNSIIMLLILSVLGCASTDFKYEVALSSEDGNSITFYTAPTSFALKQPASDTVRNVIVCIGDGMGFNHVSLARSTAKADQLWMETLPVTGQATTRSANKAVTDSAAAGTALACGIKTNNGMIGMAPDKTPYRSILECMAASGCKTGLVVTSQITHATPATFASHIKSRNDQAGIAPQLLDNHVDVLFGGGLKYWLPISADGIRKDGVDMLNKARSAGYQVVKTRDEMFGVKQSPVLGLFGKDGLTTFTPEPSLAEMSRKAIGLLGSNKQDGFFLMIEGSQIDWAAHANDTDRTIRQTLLFDVAVREAIDFAKRDGHTLLIVTADHETGGLELKPGANGGTKAKWTSGGHTGVNVPVYAFGPGAEKFSGEMDDTDIPTRIAELIHISPFPRKKPASP